MATLSIRQRLTGALRGWRKGWDVGPGFIQGKPAPLSGAWVPVGNLPWDRMRGETWANSIVSAAIQYIIRNAAQTPPQVYDNTGAIVEEHPLTLLLERPTVGAAYGGDVLQAMTLFSWIASGNAYWQIVGDTTLGMPRQLWYLPHWRIRPMRRSGSKDWITHYDYYPDRGNRIELPPEQVVHMRFGMDPEDTLLGMSPLAAVSRELYNDNDVAEYMATVLRNLGIMGKIISPKDVASEMDGEGVQKALEVQTTGAKRGRTLFLDGAVEVSDVSTSPDKMALTEYGQRAEARICAVLGLPAQVLGLTVAEGTKTYANYEQAREAAWEECIVPNLTAIWGQVGTALLPRMGAQRGLRLAPDTREVRALQPDLDKLHQRVRDDYRAGLMDRADARAALDMEVRPEDEGLYWSVPTRPVDEPSPSTSATSAAKHARNGGSRVDWADRVAHELEALHGAG